MKKLGKFTMNYRGTVSSGIREEFLCDLVWPIGILKAKEIGYQNTNLTYEKYVQILDGFETITQ